MSLKVGSFLGFINYYCRFIRKYAQIGQTPIYKLISGENAARKQNSIKWDPGMPRRLLTSSEELCTNAPILAYANFEKPFKLHTDVSDFSV